MGPVKKLWRSKKLSGPSRMKGRVIMCWYNPSLITIYRDIFTLNTQLFFFRGRSQGADDQGKVNETSPGMQRVYLCLMPQYLLSAITIVYWVFTHSITPPPAWPSRVIYQVRGPGPGFNARSMQIMSSNGGRRARDTRVSNYLETTSHPTSLSSHIIIIAHHTVFIRLLDNKKSETGKVRILAARKS